MFIFAARHYPGVVSKRIFPFDIHSVAMYIADMIEKELVAAPTEPLILSLLSKGESYGYELIQEVKRLSGDKIKWTDGMRPRLGGRAPPTRRDQPPHCSTFPHKGRLFLAASRA
ncbi:MAG: hypothetical protein ABSF95_14160 [Verrucomicrobiota bacterium]